MHVSISSKIDRYFRRVADVRTAGNSKARRATLVDVSFCPVCRLPKNRLECSVRHRCAPLYAGYLIQRACFGACISIEMTLLGLSDLSNPMVWKIPSSLSNIKTHLAVHYTI